MNNDVILRTRTSILLYLYIYPVVVALGVGLYFLHPMLVALAAGAMIGLLHGARSQRYELTKDVLHLSASYFDDEAATVFLANIKTIAIIDRPPWSWLGYGTLVLVVDRDALEHACVRCVKHPVRLAFAIRGQQKQAGFTGCNIVSTATGVLADN